LLEALPASPQSIHRYDPPPINPQGRGLFLDMGLGKTAIVLSALYDLLTEGDPTLPQHPLVIGPKRVIENTWPQEIEKWSPLSSLTYQVIAGTPQERKQAVATPAHIHLVSRDNIEWLTHAADPWPFDLIVIDELTSFKNPSSKRFKALRRILPLISTVWGLTGTPIPNGFEDLWAQIYLLDRGASLGHSVTNYRATYFDASPYTPFPSYKLKPTSEVVITNKIKPFTLSLASGDANVLLPEYNEVHIDIPPTPEIRRAYDTLRRDMALDIPGDDGNKITLMARHQAALTSKLLQFSSGRVYTYRDPDRPTAPPIVEAPHIHELKLQHLDRILDDAADLEEQVLIFYQFKHELEALLHRYPKARTFTGDTLKDAITIDSWSRRNGQCPILVVHPASAGHGLNLQNGGHIAVWTTPTYDLELWQQANKRLHRPGQLHTVTTYILTLQGCLDSTVYSTVLQQKASLQQTLLDELRPEWYNPEQE
jgi:SNF2 family DNA or RNA helicase